MNIRTMQRLRRLHLYVGMIFAPAIIFFAFSGMIQTIGLQDGPAPPGWIRVMANIHKKQVVSRPARPRSPGPEAAAARRPRPAEAPPPASAIPFKVFVLLLSVGLIASAALGIVIALANRATRRMSWIMLAVGVILPVALLAL